MELDQLPPTEAAMGSLTVSVDVLTGGSLAMRWRSPWTLSTRDAVGQNLAWTTPAAKMLTTSPQMDWVMCIVPKLGLL